MSPESGAPASPTERIKLALRLVAEDPLSDPRLTRRLLAAVMRRRDIRPGHALARLLAMQVRQAQAVGEIRAELDSIYLGRVIRTLFFQHVMMWHHGYRPAPLADMVDATVDMLLEGIAGPNWEGSS